MQNDFERENAVVIGVSTDSFYTHKAWFESDPRLMNINYPVIADTGHQVSGAFDVLLDDGAALRGTFIIDPEGILRHMSINELDVGRNVSETLRVLQALRTGELCPVGWKPGESTLTTYDEWLAKALPRLSKQVLVDTTKKLETTKYSAGQMVFEQGDAPDRFYIMWRSRGRKTSTRWWGENISGSSSGRLLRGDWALDRSTSKRFDSRQDRC